MHLDNCTANKPSEKIVFQMASDERLYKLSAKSLRCEVSVLPLQCKNDSDKLLSDMGQGNSVGFAFCALSGIVSGKSHVKAD